RRVEYLSDPNPSIFQHYWSLGVEEQFYLMWPLLLAIAYAIFRRRPRGILTALIVTFVISVSLCWWLTFRSQPWAFFMMPTRAWEFAAGGIVAFFLTSTRMHLPVPVARLTGWLGLTLLLGSAVLFDDGTTFPGFAALLPVAATALVIFSGSVLTNRWSASRALASGPLVFVGAISYSLYLVHWPMLVIPQIVYSDRHLLPVPVTLALVAASFPIAWLIYTLIENPARSWRLLSTRRPRLTLLAAVAVAILVAVPLRGAAQIVETQPLHTNQLVQASSSLQQISATPFVPANLSPSLRDASSDNPATYANGCHLPWEVTSPVGCSVGSGEAPITLALFGDSHAAHWYPAFARLAEDGAIKLKNHTKSSCPSAEMPVLRLGVPYTECQVWRSAVVRELVRNPPDVVVLSNFAEGAGDPADPSFVRAWGAAMEQTIARMSTASKVIVMADTPHFEVAPSTCLSAHLSKASACGASPEHALWPATFQAERAAALTNGGYVVNLNTALCSQSLCPAIIGNLLVYRDSHHLTATFAESQAPALLQELSSVFTTPASRSSSGGRESQ
ncbi:MAG: acyltransferase, partial [Polaromonas sp.]|nr:acyltransferase [Polaromonas sp.]